MIRLRALTKAFGSRVALAGIDLDVAAGERVLLVGPNGAGKTTLLRILATLTRPTSGTVEIAGHDATRANGAVRRMIGFLAHESLLYEDLTARQNLRFYADMYDLPDSARRIEELLETVELRARGDTPVRALSRGMQQRLAVARAVLHRPSLLLLDEPFTGLDVLAAEALTVLLETLVESGCTLLLTTHHPAEEGRLARRAVVVGAGRVIEDGPIADPAAFMEHYRTLLQRRRVFAEAV